MRDDDSQNHQIKPKPDFLSSISSKANRKLKARRQNTPGVWFGLGMMGMVGWSVVVPTLLGAAVGLWVDKHYASSQSWTLALLIGGLSVGCINAWYWIDKEAKTMREEQNNDTEL